MNQKEYFQQAMKTSQTLFDNAYDLTVLLQDQYEKIAATLLDQVEWLPAESRKMIDGCVDTYKSSRSHFKSYMDEGYKQTENFFR